MNKALAQIKCTFIPQKLNNDVCFPKKFSRILKFFQQNSAANLFRNRLRKIMKMRTKA